MKYLVYIIASFLQPICWPLPEMSTILYGTYILGSVKAFVVGYIFILLGIVFMYKITFMLSKKYLIKFKNKKSFKTFQNYILNNQILAIGTLFILPILPDEVICIGSAILEVKFKVFMIIAIFAKFISIGLVAFSSDFASLLSISWYVVLIVEFLVIFIISTIYKKLKG